MMFPLIHTHKNFIDGLCKNSCILEAAELFRTLHNTKFELDLTVFNCLVDGLCKSWRLRTAWELFKKLPRYGPEPNVVTYTVMICGLCIEGGIEKAYDLLPDMEEKVVLQMC